MSIIVLPRGGFGNILFNVLIGLSFSKKYGMPVFFISDYQDKRPNIKTYRIFKNLPFLNSRINIGINIHQTFSDKEFGYTDIQIHDTTKNYLLNGYFQSFKFSLEYITEIKQNLYNFIPDIIKNVENIWHDVLLNGVPVCLHVRRGDYLQLQHVHPVQSDEYYKTSIEKIKSIEPKAFFIVFSDDIPFVKNWSVLKNLPYMIVESDVETSFVMMSKCKHFIISNSSLSLLAYYFRDERESKFRFGASAESIDSVLMTESKLCIPRKWFASQGPKYDLGDLISDPDNTFII